MKPVMNAVAAAVALYAFGGAAHASMPVFQGTCPMDIKLESDKHGNVLINGHKSSVKKFNDTYWEAKHKDVTISIAKEGNDAIVSYTAKGGVNGICTVTAKHGASSGAASKGGVAIPPRDEQACLQAVSIETNNGEVAVLETWPSEANNQVIIGVGTQRAKWKCLVKDGKVAEVMSLTDEGAL